MLSNQFPAVAARTQPDAHLSPVSSLISAFTPQPPARSAIHPQFSAPTTFCMVAKRAMASRKNVCSSLKSSGLSEIKTNQNISLDQIGCSLLQVSLHIFVHLNRFFSTTSSLFFANTGVGYIPTKRSTVQASPNYQKHLVAV
jgi:hypothetical protein